MAEENRSYRSGFAAIVGRPNVGKSTLMNRLIGQKIAITSEKPQTTRSRIQTVYSDDRGQIVFLDTPGIQKARNKLGDYMLRVSESTFQDADVVLWLVEPSTFIGAGEKHIADLLKKTGSETILVINKCDTVRKEELLPCIAKYRDVYSFSEIIPVSALNGDGVEELTDLIFRHLPEGPQYFDEETVTDQTVREIAAEIVREKALRFLSDEIPHGIAVVVDRMEERPDGSSHIEASIICEKDSHKGIVIGKGGSMLKKIGIAARRDIETLTGGRTDLRLFVKVRKEWRDNLQYLSSYGYKD